MKHVTRETLIKIVNAMLDGNMDEVKEYIEVEFDECNENIAQYILSDLDFSNENLSGINLNDLYFHECNFEGATFGSQEFKFCRFDDCLFDRAIFENVTISNTVLFVNRCTSTKFMYCNFINSKIHACNFNSAHFESISFIDVEIESEKKSLSFINTFFKNIFFKDTTLCNNDFSEVKCFPYVPYACPYKGEFIGYKMVLDKDRKLYLCKLLIPADAKRSSGIGNKCRCSKAKVLNIYSIEDHRKKIKTAYSVYFKDFEYHVGEEIIPNGFDDNRFNECAQGIHFFMSEQEVLYYFS